MSNVFRPLAFAAAMAVLGSCGSDPLTEESGSGSASQPVIRRGQALTGASSFYDTGFPTAACHATGTSVACGMPATAGTNRLVYLAVAGFNASNVITPVTVTSGGGWAGLTWTRIVSAEWSRGGVAQIWAAWAAAQLGTGTVTVKPALSTDIFVTGYAGSNTASCSADVTRCFGATGIAKDEAGKSGRLGVSLANTSASSAAVSVAANYHGSSPQAGSGNTLDASWVGANGGYASYTYSGSMGGTIAVGSSETTSYYLACGAEILGPTTSGGVSAITLSDVSVTPGASAQVGASIAGGGTGDVYWYTSDPAASEPPATPGGDSTHGTIGATGLYAAPAGASAGSQFAKVWAVSKASAAVSDSAYVNIAAEQQAAPPTISSFTASPGSISAGSSATLSWATSGATSLSIDQGVGAVTGASATVSPMNSTTYTLTATNASGSAAASASVTVSAQPQAATPTFSPAPGTYGSAVSVTLSVGTPGATIHYTTDGSAPTTGSTPYSGPLTVNGTAAISAIAVAAGCLDSGLARGTYTIAPGLAAFPGCQGSGCRTLGGRGGAVYRVTNLNDSGTGSLRACAQASGPRTCVFTVGGHIALRSTLAISNPYLTIAGQTAPGGGIELSGQTTSGSTTLSSDLVQIQTHDVVIRFVKMRLGSVSNPNYANSLVVQSGNQYNLVVDHCTLMWGKWDNLSIYATGSGSNHDQTYSWNIIAEPLIQPGATGSVNQNVSGANSTIANNSTDIDMHHNLIASGNHRNPMMRTASGRLVNNLVYNYNYYAMKAKGNWDIVGNYFKAGPVNRNPPHEIETWTSQNGNNTTLPPSLYLSGNAGPHNSSSPVSGVNQTADWQLTAFSSAGDSGESSSPLSTSYKRANPLATASSGLAIAADVATDLADPNGTFLGIVGASQTLACAGGWVNNRDTVDARIVNEFATGGGTSNTALSTISGYPTLAQGTPCADTNGDGIPDAYETAKGASVGSMSPTHVNSDGYTDLDHYLNGG